jgi:hypothetical protein
MIDIHLPGGKHAQTCPGALASDRWAALRATSLRAVRRQWLPLWTAAVVGALAAGAQAQIVVNEVMADNQGAVENGPDFPDFIELHNRSASAAGAGNMSVTDDPAVPRKFVIPAGTTIPGGGYLVLWCDSNAGSPGLHTGFGLGANTDRVQLYGTDGATLLDDIAFGIAVPNLSIGRIPNGTGAWTLTQPTPSAANTEQPLGAKAELSLNEWMASPATGEDWIEVYNGSGLPVALGGVVITDTAPGTEPDNRAIPALSFIGGNGYAQFFASNLDEQDADHLDFRLGAGGETLTLSSVPGGIVRTRIASSSFRHTPQLCHSMPEDVIRQRKSSNVSGDMRCPRA